MALQPPMSEAAGLAGIDEAGCTSIPATCSHLHPWPLLPSAQAAWDRGAAILPHGPAITGHLRTKENLFRTRRKSALLMLLLSHWLCNRISPSLCIPQLSQDEDQL